MAWNLNEALDYYKRMGAPADQNALISLLTEIQQEHGGSIPKSILPEIAAYYGTREALLAAHREDLIGSGPKCLIRAVPPKAGGYTSAPPKTAPKGKPAAKAPAKPAAKKPAPKAQPKKSAKRK